MCHNKIWVNVGQSGPKTSSLSTTLGLNQMRLGEGVYSGRGESKVVEKAAEEEERVPQVGRGNLSSRLGERQTFG